VTATDVRGDKKDHLSNLA